MNKDRREQISQMSTSLNILKEKIEGLSETITKEEGEEMMDSDVQAFLNTEVEIEFQISKRKQFKEKATVLGWLESIHGDIENVRDEEQEYRDNMPESLQDSEKASAADDAVSNLDDAYSSMEQAVSGFQEAGEDFSDAISSLEEAINSLDSVE